MKKLLKVTPSGLEGFRLYLSDADDVWFNTQKLIEDITGEFQETELMQRGTAWHKLIEDAPNTPYPEVAEVNGYRFDTDKSLRIVRDWLSVPAVHECWGERTLDIPGLGTIVVRTKADAVYGNMGGEWKSSGKPPKAHEKFCDSVQWRLCCWALHLRSIDYRAVQLGTDKGSDIYYPKAMDYDQFIFNERFEMPRLVALIRRYVQFYRDHDLMKYMEVPA